MLLLGMLCVLVVLVLIFGEVDVGELDEKGEDRGVMIITVVDSQLESLNSHLAASTELYVLQQCYNSQFRS